MRVKRMSETTKDVAVVQHRLYRYKKASAISQKRVEATFRILLADEHVRAVLINIFGGIVRCERIAHGVIEAAKEVDIKIPVVVRLQGTNADEGRKLLQESGLKIEVATDLWEAAQKIVALTGKRRKKADAAS